MLTTQFVVHLAGDPPAPFFATLPWCPGQREQWRLSPKRDWGVRLPVSGPAPGRAARTGFEVPAGGGGRIGGGAAAAAAAAGAVTAAVTV